MRRIIVHGNPRPSLLSAADHLGEDLSIAPVLAILGCRRHADDSFGHVLREMRSDLCEAEALSPRAYDDVGAGHRSQRLLEEAPKVVLQLFERRAVAAQHAVDVEADQRA